MPFIPHTDDDIRAMLDVIGVDSIADLFDEIPDELLVDTLDGVPEPMSEMEIGRLMRARAESDGAPLSFIGAGAYEHHIPAAVWEITTRGEFYSAYTPYQAEASQGTLQTMYEYQSMIAALTGLPVANASLYDAASGLAEAALMAVRGNRRCKSRRVLLAAGVNPAYERTADAIAGTQGLRFERLELDTQSGTTRIEALESAESAPVAIVIQQPTFFGTLEDVDRLSDWARERGALVIAVPNPTSLAILEAPGNWGAEGADIAVGEGQPLGVPLSSGGPYFGFMACTDKLMRQMPGRIAGRTTDVEGNVGYTLTLQAREQHIRRSKATSNICTNQGLLVTAATLYLSLLGAEGLARVAAVSQQQTAKLLGMLTDIDGVRPLFHGPHFHEAAVQLDQPIAPVLEALAARDILGGYDLSRDFPELGNALLVCATETKLDADLETYAGALAEILSAGRRKRA